MNESCCPTPPEKLPKTSSQEVQGESCCELHPPTKRGSAPCPSCAALSKRVQRITLGALLKPQHRANIPQEDEFSFCPTPECDVVYFRNSEVLFRKADISVPVHQKDPDNPKVPVCYCFGWTPEKIYAEVEETGQSSAIDVITAQVRAGNCYCEVTNPQGSCCLGNVSKAVKRIMTLTQTKTS